MSTVSFSKWKQKYLWKKCMRIHLAPTTICQEWTILLIFCGNMSLLPTCVRDVLPTWLRWPHQSLGPSSRWEDLLAFARLSITAAPCDLRRSHRIHIRLFLLLPHPLPSCWFGRSLDSRRRRRRAFQCIYREKSFLFSVIGSWRVCKAPFYYSITITSKSNNNVNRPRSPLVCRNQCSTCESWTIKSTSR